MRKLKEITLKNFIIFAREHWPLIVILLLGLTPLLWYKPDFFVARGDYFPFVNPLANSRFMFTWSDAAALGSIPQAGNPAPMQSIWFGIWYILTSAGLDVGSIQTMLQVVYFLGAGLSMYLLASTVYKQGKLTPFIASIFYMFNLVMFFRNFNDVASWFVVLLPLMIFFYIRIIRNVRQGQKITGNIIALSLLSTLLLSFSVTNPAFTILTIAVFLVLFSYSLLTEKGIRLKVCKALGLLTGITLLINIWWIIPFLIETTSYAGGAIQLGTTTDVAGWSFVYGRSSFLNLFWLNGIWNWLPEYFPFTTAYANPGLQLAVFVPIILAFTALFFNGKYRKINLCFALTIIFLMFLAKGLHPPLGDINLFLYNHIPGAFIFREPFLKLYLFLIIPMALLIGFATTSLLDKLKLSRIPHKKILSILLFFIIVSSFIISVFPMFDNNLLFEKTDALPFSSYVQIPDYWYQLSNYINSIPDNFRVLQTPGDNFYQVPYAWGYYGSDAIASSLITKPVVQNSFGYASVNDMASLVYQEIDANNSIDFVNTLSLLNIKYIIQRNDLLWNYSGRNMHSPEYMKAFLTNTTDIKLASSFGPLDLYEVVDSQSRQRIYQTDNLVFINGSFNDFIRLLSNDTSSINSSFFIADQLSEGQNQFIGSLPLRQVLNKTYQTTTEPTENGRQNPFTWDNLANESMQIRYFSGWKNVVLTDGNETQDAISFPSLSSCPYEFSSAYNGTGWAALNSTIVYIKTGNSSVAVDQILANGQSITDIIGAWWQTGWEGMGTKPLQFPIIIPANQEAIIQLNHIITDNITFVENTAYNTISNMSVVNQTLPKLTVNVINPTKIQITIQNASQPFFIVFGENYDPQWKAYASSSSTQLSGLLSTGNAPLETTTENIFTPQDIYYLFDHPINDQHHFIANGYANAWYIDPQQLHEGTTFTITLFFAPQAYYYIGVIVTLVTIIIATAYMLFAIILKGSVEKLISLNKKKSEWLKSSK